MSHCSVVCSALCLRCLTRRYVKKKKEAMLKKLNGGCSIISCLIFILKFLCICCVWTSRNKKFRFFLKLSMFCFLAFILVYILLVVVILHMKISFVWGIVISVLLALFLMVLMNDFYTVRVFVFLALPQAMNKYGRHALVLYCFLLIVLGPVRNILENIVVMTRTLGCVQANLKEELAILAKILKEPLLEIKEVADRLMKGIQEKFRSTLEEIHAIERLILAIMGAFETMAKWLAKHLSMCNSVLGTPYDRCFKAFEESEKNCRENIIAALSGLCSIETVVEVVCYTLKPVDLFCKIANLVEEGIRGLAAKLKETISKVEDFFYVDVDIKDQVVGSVHTSEEPSVVMKRVMKGIEEDVARHLILITWLGSTTLIILLILFARVLWYRRKYLTVDRFDNAYITKEMVDYDIEMARKRQRTVLPLRNFEKSYYIRISSCFLNGTEKMSLLKNSVFMFFSSLKVAIFLLLDHYIFWIINGVYNDEIFGNEKSAFDYSGMQMKVQGEGFHADLYTKLMNQILKFRYVLSSAKLRSCHTRPSPPDYDMYLHIAVILSICWISIIIQPYVLRLRNRVMAAMYPERAKERVEWLHQKILLDRDTLFTKTYASLQHVFNIRVEETPNKETMMEFLLRRILPGPLHRLMLTFSNTRECMQCRNVQYLKSCSTYKCKGLFCRDCWGVFQQKCPLCSKVESDFSEEVDSEDEERYRKKMAKCRSKCEKRMLKRSPISEEELSTKNLRGDEAGTSHMNADPQMKMDPVKELVSEGETKYLRYQEGETLTREMNFVIENNRLRNVTADEEDFERGSLVTIAEAEFEIYDDMLQPDDLVVVELENEEADSEANLSENQKM